VSHMLLHCDCGGVRYEDEPCKFCARLEALRGLLRDTLEGVIRLEHDHTRSEPKMSGEVLWRWRCTSPEFFVEDVRALVARLREALGRQEDEQP